MGRSFKNTAADAEKALEGGSVGPLPTGEYILRIDDVQDTKAANQGENKNLDALNLKMVVIEAGTGKGVGRKVSAFRVPLFDKWASGNTAFEFFTFHKALGVDFSEDGEVDLPDNEEILGQEIGAYLTIGEENAKGQRFNEVKRWFPASDGAKESVPTDGGSGSSGNGDLDGDTTTSVVL